MPKRWDKIWTRDEWQKERGKFQVKKGATKVSMGDALDRFRKANNAGVAKGQAALPNLKKAVASYKQQIKPKSPALADRIEKFLEAYIKEYEKDAPKFATAQHDYPQAKEAAAREMRQVGGELVAWQQGGRNGQFKPSNSKAAGQAVMHFFTIAYRALQISDAIDEMKLRPMKTPAQQADSGTWTEKGTEGIMKIIAEMPDRV